MARQPRHVAFLVIVRGPFWRNAGLSQISAPAAAPSMHQIQAGAPNVKSNTWILHRVED